MIKKFLKQLFCFHDYKEVGVWRLDGRWEIKYQCPKCGKEHWGYIRDY